MDLRENATESDRKLCEQFAVALREFESKHWLEAAKKYEAILSTHSKDGPAQFYLQLCQKYCKDEPPAGDEPCVIRIE